MIFTFTQVTHGNNINSTIECEGYNEVKAMDLALRALKYACCKDFTRPSTMGKGYTAIAFEAEGFEVETDDAADVMAEEKEWDFATVFEFEGKKYAFPGNFDEYYNGVELKSDDVRQLESFMDI